MAERIMTVPHTKSSLARRILSSRFHVGINSCTRAMERCSKNSSSNSSSSNNCVSLILACRDIYPPTTHAHIPFLVLQQERNGSDKDIKHASTNTLIPSVQSSLSSSSSSSSVLMLLPGKSSMELGQILGIKTCSMLCVTSRNMDMELEEGVREGLVDEHSDEVDRYHAKIDSFVEFCKSKI